MDYSSGVYPKASDVERTYRSLAAPDLQKFRVAVGESDLMVLSSRDIREKITVELKRIRLEIKGYIHQYPVFQETLKPLTCQGTPPETVKWMIQASAAAGVGPMAAVAGAIAGTLGRNIEPSITDLIIENGGDIYLRSGKPRLISVYAGNSPLSNKIGLRIEPSPGLGICTSAGTVGPSLSFGKADAAVILSPDVALADAVATATANRIKDVNDLAHALEFAKNIMGVKGVLLIKDNQLAAWGMIELVPI